MRTGTRGGLRDSGGLEVSGGFGVGTVSSYVVDMR